MESCLHINHFGQPHPEGILLSSASFFHTEGGSQSRDSLKFKMETFLDIAVCVILFTTLYVLTHLVSTQKDILTLLWECRFVPTNFAFGVHRGNPNNPNLLIR